MKKFVAFVRSLFDLKFYIDAGLLDFSGQGRDKYGN